MCLHPSPPPWRRQAAGLVHPPAPPTHDQHQNREYRVPIRFDSYPIGDDRWYQPSSHRSWYCEGLGCVTFGLQHPERVADLRSPDNVDGRWKGWSGLLHRPEDVVDDLKALRVVPYLPLVLAHLLNVGACQRSDRRLAKVCPGYIGGGLALLSCCGGPIPICCGRPPLSLLPVLVLVACSRRR